VCYGQTFLIGTADPANITKVTWIRLSSVTHAFNQNQSRANLLELIGTMTESATTSALTVAAHIPPGDVFDGDQNDRHNRKET
jgi:Domain of unknown function (DUF1929)